MANRLKESKNRHGLFYAIAFMTIVVIGSVLVYSFFLPQTAPKQITLAVLPLTEREGVTPNSIGFTAALRDSLALSRDVAVVDNLSTLSVALSEEKVPELAGLLGITHFVDGSLSKDSDGLLTEVHYRLINVSNPDWKEVKNEVIAIEPNTNKPYQDVRDAITLSVRKGLYDNSMLRTESLSHDPSDFKDWLQLLGASLMSSHNDRTVDERNHLHLQVLRAAYAKYGIIGDLTGLYWGIIDEFDQTNDIEKLKSDLWNHVGEYPNSSGVDLLAQLYLDLGAIDTAELLWLRTSRVNPLSSEVALKIADARWRMNDFEGSNQAMRIASQRSEVDAYMACYQELYDHSANSSGSPDEVSSTSTTSCDTVERMRLPLRSLRDLRFHQDQIANQDEVNSLIGNFIGASPKFTPDDDPRWVELKETLIAKRYQPADELVIPKETTEDVALLLAPRRPD